jgi:hypothetical protein
MHVSEYQSIDMHYIVLHVKFDGRLAISVLRNEQLFTKNQGFKTDQFSKSSNFQTFQLPPFGKRTAHPLGKRPTFFGSQFSCERDRQPTIQFNTDLEVPFIYRLIPRRLDFLE